MINIQNTELTLKNKFELRKQGEAVDEMLLLGGHLYIKLYHFLMSTLSYLGEAVQSAKQRGAERTM